MLKKSITLLSLGIALLLTGCAGNKPNPLENLPNLNTICGSDNAQARKFYSYGIAAQNMEYPDHSRRLFIEAIMLDPSYCDAMDRLALIYQERRNYDLAIYWFNESLSLNPDNTVALGYLAESYSLSGSEPEARRVFRQLISLAPNLPEGYYGLGLSYLLSHEGDSALVYLKEANKQVNRIDVSMVSRDQIWNLMGRAYIEADSIPQGINYLQRSYNSFKNDGSTNGFLAIGLFKSGSINSARDYMRLAMQRDFLPDNKLLIDLDLLTLKVSERFDDGSPKVTQYINKDDESVYKTISCVDADCNQSIISGYYPNGSIQEELTYSNGQLNGPVRSYHEDGRLASTRQYQQDLEHGEFASYNSAGIQISAVSYLDGQLHGPYQLWYKNGTLREKGRYNLGTQVDTLRMWYPSGQIQQKAIYSDGLLTGRYLYWHPNGKLEIDGQYHNGRKDGWYRTWYDTGQPAFEARYVDNVIAGKAYEWFSSGELKKEYSVNGKMGTVTYYDSNQQVEAKEEYNYQDNWEYLR